MQTNNARDHDLIQSLSSTIAELPDATVNDFVIEPGMTLQARPDASLEASIAGQELLLIIGRP